MPICISQSSSIHNVQMHACFHTYIHTYVTPTHNVMHTHICIHTYIHMSHIQTHTYTCIHKCIHTYVHTCIHIYVHKHSYIHTYIHTCVHTYTYIHSLHSYMHAMMYGYICTFVDAHMPIAYVPQAVRTHKHTFCFCAILLNAKWCSVPSKLELNMPYWLKLRTRTALNIDLYLFLHMTW